jgi:hypothetical protein
MRQCLFAKKSCNLTIVHLSSSPREVQKKTETNSHLSSSLRDDDEEEEEEENRPTRSCTAAAFSEGISEIPKIVIFVVGFACQGKNCVFRFIIEYNSFKGIWLSLFFI